MALRVIDHYPDINATGIPRNIYVKAQFSSAIVPGSLEYTTFSVNDASNFTTVPGELGVEYNSSGQAVIVQFRPILNLTAYTKYNVYVFGAPNSVISATGEQLSTTYTWQFTTGAGLLEGQVPAGIPSGDLDLSGVPGGDATGVIASGITSFYVVSTDPQNQEPNVVTQLSGIYITFNTDVASSDAELSGAITIDESYILS